MTHRINYKFLVSVRLLTTNISQWVSENFCSYCKKTHHTPDPVLTHFIKMAFKRRKSKNDMTKKSMLNQKSRNSHAHHSLGLNLMNKLDLKNCSWSRNLKCNFTGGPLQFVKKRTNGEISSKTNQAVTLQKNKEWFIQLKIWFISMLLRFVT